MRLGMGNLKIMKYFSDVIFFGMDDIFILCIYIFVHSSSYLCVCGDDQITCYPGVDDLTGEPGDA